MRDIEVGRIYRHFKGSTNYIRHIAEHTETGELMVVPKSLVMNVLTYCENQSIYDKLSDYDDFYYKLKREYDSQNKSI